MTKEQSQELERWARRAFAFARETGDTKADQARFVAYTTGHCARRMDLPWNEVQRWLQGAYSSVWVREGNLDPGLDMKDVQASTEKGYRRTQGSKRA